MTTSAAGLQSADQAFRSAAGTTYYFMVAGALVRCGNLVFALDAAPLPLVPAEGDVGPGAQSSRRTRRILRGRSTRADGPAFVSLYMQEPGGPRVRVNRPRTHGWSGGFVGNSFVYQEASRTPVESSSFTTSAPATRSAPPPGVNTARLGVAADDDCESPALWSSARSTRGSTRFCSAISRTGSTRDSRPDPLQKRVHLARAGERQLRRLAPMRQAHRALQRLPPRHRGRDYDDDSQPEPATSTPPL